MAVAVNLTPTYPLAIGGFTFPGYTALYTVILNLLVAKHLTWCLRNRVQANWHANDWANGSLRGMELRKEYWDDLIDDEEHGGSLVPIFALAHENSTDPAMRPYKKPVSAELRETLIVGAAAGMNKIYHYFEAQRLLGNDSIGNVTTFRRFTPKIGRNEPCPCGSGKKFKQCCGKITLH
jgi:uncharacterized protein